MPSQPASLNAGCKRCSDTPSCIAAPDTARQELLLVERRRRPDQPLRAVRRSVLYWRANSGIATAPAARPVSTFRRFRSAPSNGSGTGSRRKKAELDPAFRAIGHAVQCTDDIRLCATALREWIVAALAVQQATVAILAMGRLFYSPRMDQREKSPNSAPADTPRGTRSGDAQVQRRIAMKITPSRKPWRNALA